MSLYDISGWIKNETDVYGKFKKIILEVVEDFWTKDIGQDFLNESIIKIVSSIRSDRSFKSPYIILLQNLGLPGGWINNTSKA